MGEEMLELVVGDEAPYLVLARLGVKNTITTGGKFRLCENGNLKRGGGRQGQRQARRHSFSNNGKTGGAGGYTLKPLKSQ